MPFLNQEKRILVCKIGVGDVTEPVFTQIMFYCQRCFSAVSFWNFIRKKTKKMLMDSLITRENSKNTLMLEIQSISQTFPSSV